MRPLQFTLVEVRAREESNLQPPGPQPGVLSVELRAQVVTFYFILNSGANRSVISLFLSAHLFEDFPKEFFQPLYFLYFRLSPFGVRGHQKPDRIPSQLSS